MKIFISSDIEGTSGACNWDEALETDHHKFLGPQMTKEVAAAASAAILEPFCFAWRAAFTARAISSLPSIFKLSRLSS